MFRQITNKELADISDEWENATIDTRKYYQTVLKVWEVDKEFYLECKKNGIVCQEYNGKYYVG